MGILNTKNVTNIVRTKLKSSPPAGAIMFNGTISNANRKEMIGNTKPHHLFALLERKICRQMMPAKTARKIMILKF